MNIVWLEYQEGIIFQRFKEKDKFSTMITEFGVGKSVISFRITIAALTN